MTSAPERERDVPTPPPINPRRPWRRRPLTWFAAGAVLVVVAGLLVAWAPWRVEPTVRVGDGSDPFVAYLGQVADLIHTENQRVSSSGREFVSIAFMHPIRTTHRQTNAETAIRHEMEGAFLAQYWANRGNNAEGVFTDSAPLIRLLLADMGEDGTAWPETVAQLGERMAGEHLVAVAGLGSSTEETQAAANELARRQIPMFGAVITSGRLTAPNLARVAPTNADEARAAIQHVRNTPEWQVATPAEPYEAYLVQDTNPADSYNLDLGAAYREAFSEDSAHTLLDVRGEFDSSVPAVGNALASQADRICTLRPDLVLFAGRGDDMRTFLGKLDERPCAATGPAVTVVSGDDIDHLANVPGLWKGEGIRVLYTGLASPQSWDGDTAGGRPFSRVAIDRFRGRDHSYATLFGGDLEEHLADGHAIMAYDATLTAIEAARRARTDDAPIPEPRALVNGLHQINADTAVPGASGWIYFENRNERPEWLPHNKAIPIMNLDRDGRSTLVRLAYPLGAG